MSRIVYLAGKMNGLYDKGRAQFAAAEEHLAETKGWVILNPARLPDNWPHTAYMPLCLSLVEKADTVALLPGWRSSPGALLERDYALYQGKKIIELNADLDTVRADAAYDEDEC